MRPLTLHGGNNRYAHRGPLAAGRINHHGSSARGGPLPEIKAAAEAKAAGSFSAGPEEYIGMVKSYNDRRGFGFVACEATAARFGRDVYIGKAEAQLAFAESCGSKVEAKSQLPTLAEEDLIRFKVRLSQDMFPQAEQIRRVKTITGVVIQPPHLEETADEPPLGRIRSDDLLLAFGVHEAVLRRRHCGQMRLLAGDRVSFCVEGPRDAGSRENTIEALLVIADRRQQVNCSHSAVLGCFCLNLPRSPLGQGWPVRADLYLACHAIGENIIVSGLPDDSDEAELMQFFGKHGAAGASMVATACDRKASVHFPTVAELVRFVSRTIHTFADDRETRLARLCPPNPVLKNRAFMPALPKPALSAGEEAGILVIQWNSALAAQLYQVELRTAGVQARWNTVDTSGKLNEDRGARFEGNIFSCKVVGLSPNVVYEARVTYFTVCGCQSDPSDVSDWCQAYPTQVPAAMRLAPQVDKSMAFPVSLHQQLATGNDMWMNNWQAAQRTLPTQMNSYIQTGWRCVHGTVIPSPAMPELRTADESGYALLVAWPVVPHAVAYVVELREPGAMHPERFMRSVPPQATGNIVELSIGGLKPISGPGRCYYAQVKSVAACGCESEASPVAVYQPMASAHQAPTLSLAAACPPPSPMPPPILLQQMPPPIPPLPTAEESSKMRYSMCAGNPSSACTNGLPNLLGARAPPVPPPTGAPQTVDAATKVAPTVTGNEDDCIILD